jgi:hypothetical protein
MIAAGGGHEAVVELLLRCGAIRRGAIYGVAVQRSTPAPPATQI